MNSSDFSSPRLTVDVRLRLILEAAERRRDGVGSADANVGQRKASVGAADRLVARAGRLMHRHDGDARQHAALLIRDHAAQRAGGHGLRRDGLYGKHERQHRADRAREPRRVVMGMSKLR